MPAKNKISLNIIKTLSYSDIFDYPLTPEEIHKYFIGENISLGYLNSILTEMVGLGIIGTLGNHFFLNGRSSLSELRKRKENASAPKWIIAKKAAGILKFIPMVKMIGVSGSLSMNNAKREDDIDFFIITSENALWVSRFLVNVVLLTLGLKRRRRDYFGSNLICPNMFVTLDSLRLEHNIFTAHEIAQLVPLVNKSSAYENFLNENVWVLEYLPNAFKIPKKSKYISLTGILKPLDRILYLAQRFYMKKRITSEIVNIQVARFHPKDKTKFVELLYQEKYKNYARNHTKTSVNNALTGSAKEYSFTPGY